MKYIIECIEKDAPYFSIGYLGLKNFVSSLSNAMVFDDEDKVKAFCREIRAKYNGDKYVRLMPWVYELLDDGSIGKRCYNLEK
jgi:hypothetical protein